MMERKPPAFGIALLPANSNIFEGRKRGASYKAPGRAPPPIPAAATQKKPAVHNTDNVRRMIMPAKPSAPAKAAPAHMTHRKENSDPNVNTSFDANLGVQDFETLEQDGEEWESAGQRLSASGLARDLLAGNYKNSLRRDGTWSFERITYQNKEEPLAGENSSSSTIYNSNSKSKSTTSSHRAIPPPLPSIISCTQWDDEDTSPRASNTNTTNNNNSQLHTNTDKNTNLASTKQPPRLPYHLTRTSPPPLPASSAIDTKSPLLNGKKPGSINRFSYGSRSHDRTLEKEKNASMPQPPPLREPTTQSSTNHLSQNHNHDHTTATEQTRASHQGNNNDDDEETVDPFLDPFSCEPLTPLSIDTIGYTENGADTHNASINQDPHSIQNCNNNNNLQQNLVGNNSTTAPRPPTVQRKPAQRPPTSTKSSSSSPPLPPKRQSSFGSNGNHEPGGGADVYINENVNVNINTHQQILREPPPKPIMASNLKMDFHMGMHVDNKIKNNTEAGAEERAVPTRKHSVGAVCVFPPSVAKEQDKVNSAQASPIFASAPVAEATSLQGLEAHTQVEQQEQQHQHLLPPTSTKNPHMPQLVSPGPEYSWGTSTNSRSNTPTPTPSAGVSRQPSPSSSITGLAQQPPAISVPPRLTSQCGVNMQLEGFLRIKQDGLLKKLRSSKTRYFVLQPAMRCLFYWKSREEKDKGKAKCLQGVKGYVANEANHSFTLNYADGNASITLKHACACNRGGGAGSAAFDSDDDMASGIKENLTESSPSKNRKGSTKVLNTPTKGDAPCRCASFIEWCKALKHLTDHPNEVNTNLDTSTASIESNERSTFTSNNVLGHGMIPLVPAKNRSSSSANRESSVSSNNKGMSSPSTSRHLQRAQSSASSYGSASMPPLSPPSNRYSDEREGGDCDGERQKRLGAARTSSHDVDEIRSIFRQEYRRSSNHHKRSTNSRSSGGSLGPNESRGSTEKATPSTPNPKEKKIQRRSD